MGLGAQGVLVPPSLATHRITVRPSLQHHLLSPLGA